MPAPARRVGVGKDYVLGDAMSVDPVYRTCGFLQSVARVVLCALELSFAAMALNTPPVLCPYLLL